MKKLNNLRILPKGLIKVTLDLSDRISIFMVRLKINPNAITTLGFLSGAAAGLLLGLGKPLLAAGAITLCGAFDILDGKVAKNRNKVSMFGAVYDSTLDRYSEFFILLGLAYYFRNSWVLWLMPFAFLGSTMVSYIKARTESFGLNCEVGFMQRAERLVLLISGVIIGVIFNIFDLIIIIVIIIIILVSNLTVVQRLIYVRSEDKKKSMRENNL